MGRSPKSITHEWIDSTRDSRLEGGISGPLVYKTPEMRLDMQGYTAGRPGQPRCYSLQVQFNNECPNRSLRKLAPQVIALCSIRCDETWPASKFKEKLKKSVTGFGIRPPSSRVEIGTGN